MQTFENTSFIISRIATVTRVQSDKTNASKTFTNRKWHGIVYKLSGKSQYRFSRQTFITNPGSFLYIPKHSNYEVNYIIPGESCGSCLAVNFDTVNEVTLPPFSHPLRNHEAILALFSRLDRRWAIRTSDVDHQCMSLLYELLDIVQNTLSSEYADRKKHYKINPAIEYIRNHYTEGTPDISFLAQLSGISVSYLRRLFVSAMGMPPIQYANLLRINRAKDLLAGEHKSISEVSEELGFCDPSYFNRVFKQITGENPSQYKL